MSKNKLDQFHSLVQRMLDQYLIVQRAVDYIYATKDSVSTTDTLESIRNLLMDVKQTETEIQPVRDSLQAENAQIPPATQELVDQTVQIVTTLIPRIGALEKDAVEAKENLAPAIRESVRAAQMKSAYAKQRT